MRTPEEQLVDASLDMGKALLLAGGEVTRVEDTITRILHAYGMHKVGVFTITSLIEVTARTPDGDEIVKARRIAGGYATNLDRVEQLNALSREICATCPPPQDITARVEAIKYPKPEASSAVNWPMSRRRSSSPVSSTGWIGKASTKRRTSCCFIWSVPS